MNGSKKLLGRIELRSAHRYLLQVPVEYEWEDSANSTRREVGFIRNISTGGVYVDGTRAIPPVGSRIQVEIYLPRYSRPGTGMLLSGEGHVLRTYTADDQLGFAASLQFSSEPSEDVWSEF
jgi:hypothetical protein